MAFLLSYLLISFDERRDEGGMKGYIFLTTGPSVPLMVCTEIVFFLFVCFLKVEFCSLERLLHTF